MLSKCDVIQQNNHSGSVIISMYNLKVHNVKKQLVQECNSETPKSMQNSSLEKTHKQSTDEQREKAQRKAS